MQLPHATINYYLVLIKMMPPSYFKDEKNKALLHKICIIAIFILAFSVRIYNLTGVPYGFHADEASIGYNAYTILTKGTDEYGVPFPAFFKSFGEYKSPIQIYSTVPLVAIFGLNEFSTRLTSVIYGLLSLVAVYFLSLELFKTQKHAKFIGLFSLFFLAISPWDIQFSRVAYELMPFVFYTSFGLFVFLKAQKRSWLLPVSIILFALALYSYYAGRIFIPLFGLGLLYIYRDFFLKHKKETLVSFLFLIILLIPFVKNLFSNDALIRWDQTSIFVHPPKNISVLHQIEINYGNHFSPEFLFIGGNNALPGNQILRDAPYNIGELYLFQFPLVLFGMYALFKKRNKTFFLLLLWLLIYPVGGMFSNDGSPFARRSIIGVVPFQMLSALGIIFVLEWVTKWRHAYAALFYALSALVILFSFVYYLQLYFVDYPRYSSAWWGWQYGPKDIVPYFVAHESQYDDLIMSPYFNGRFEFFKFYAPNDCSKCKVGLPQDYYNSGRKQLYALPPGYLSNYPHYTYIPLKYLYYPDGSVAYVITEVRE